MGFIAIITDEEIRKIRAIAPHLNSERLEPYIDEAISLIVIPIIGADAYKRISERQTENRNILEGDYFANEGGGLTYVNGLKKAVAYLAYSRFLLAQQVTVTSFGVGYKNGELTERTDDKALQYLSNSAREVGMQYLTEVQTVMKQGETKSGAKKKAKITIIGDNGRVVREQRTTVVSGGSGGGTAVDAYSRYETDEKLAQIRQEIENVNTNIQTAVESAENGLKTYVDSKDTEIVQNAKDYTDGKFGNIEIDCDCSFEPTLGDSAKVPTTIGGIAKDTTVEELKGKDFTEILQRILFPTINPTANVGGVAMVVNGFVNGGIYEVGDTAPRYADCNTVLNRGSWVVVNQSNRNYYGSGSNSRFFKRVGGTDIADGTQWGDVITLGKHSYLAKIDVAQGDMPINSVGQDMPGLRVPQQTLTSPYFVVYGVRPYYSNGYDSSLTAEDMTARTEVSSADARTKMKLTKDSATAMKFASEALTSTRAEMWYADENPLTSVEVWSAFDKKFVPFPTTAYETTATATIGGVVYRRFTTLGNYKGAVQLKFNF